MTTRTSKARIGGRTTVRALLLAAAAGVIALGLTGGAGGAGGAGGGGGHKVGTWMPGAHKFLGNASCVSCHSEGKKKGGSNKEGDQFDIWEKEDPHAKSFEVLSDDASKSIAGKLGIADAAKSDDCLSCHAVNAPASHRGDKWTLDEGNSCESCHGPGEKYLTPHATAGWTAKERAAKNPEQLMNEWGIFDTTNYAVRAAMCINCHLSIDKKLVDAGHPALHFEMSSFNEYAWDLSKGYRPHWEEEKGKLADARLWAVGQAASLEAAKHAGNAELTAMYTAGVAIAKKHFGADAAEALSKASYSGAAAAAAAKDLAASAGSAKSTLERKMIAAGVFALVRATFDARGEESPDAFLDASDAAGKGEEGAAYTDAIKKMADMAK